MFFSRPQNRALLLSSVEFNSGIKEIQSKSKVVIPEAPVISPDDIDLVLGEESDADQVVNDSKTIQKAEVVLVETALKRPEPIQTGKSPESPVGHPAAPSSP